MIDLGKSRALCVLARRCAWRRVAARGAPSLARRTARAAVGVERVGRATIVALGLLTGCGHTDSIRPVDVPRLARVESGESVGVTRLDGTSIEISRYREVRLIFKSGTGGYVLRRPIRVRHWAGQTWLKSGDYAAIPFEPDAYARAEIDYSYPGDIAFVATTGALAGLFMFLVYAPPGGR
jgi:hypothetical protein